MFNFVFMFLYGTKAYIIVAPHSDVKSKSQHRYHMCVVRHSQNCLVLEDIHFIGPVKQKKISIKLPLFSYPSA